MALPPPPPDPIYTLRPRCGEISSVQYVDTTGQRPSVLIGTANGTVGLWDIDTKREYWRQKCETGIISAQLSSTNKDILVLSQHGNINIWDVGCEKVKFNFSTPDPGFCNFVQLSSPSENRDLLIALANREFGEVNIYNSATGKYTSKLSVKDPQNTGMIMCLKSINISGNQHVLAGCENGSVVLFDTRQANEELANIKLYTEPVICVDYENLGVCGSPLNTLETFQIPPERSLIKLYSIELRNNGIGSVSIRHDARIMCTGGWDSRIRVFGCKKGKPLAALNFHSESVQSVAFATSDSPEKYNNLLICGSKDHRISLWKLY